MTCLYWCPPPALICICKKNTAQSATDSTWPPVKLWICYITNIQLNEPYVLHNLYSSGNAHDFVLVLT